MVDNRIVTRKELKELDNPWNSHHDVPATHEAIEKMLAGGTPDWVKWPADFKNFAAEEFQRVREDSIAMSLEYKLGDQEDLTNRAARMVNPMSTRDFIAKLRANDIKCFTVDNGFPPQTVALWCMPPRQNQRARYICYMQIPAMYEWSVLKEDQYGKPMGEDFRGWRTVLIQLIEKDILTEQQAHQIFGHPSNNPVFSRYHQSLWEVRNGRKYTQDELHANDF